LIEAEMKRKIPKIDNWEDILTSNVFELLNFLDNKYLLEIISSAKNIDSNTLRDTLKNKKIKNVELWKKFKNIGEPDIVVTLNDDSFFIIEVKYFSGEHNTKKKIQEDTYLEEKQLDGQLAKYLNIEINGNKGDFIIYLTASYMSLNQLSDDSKKKKDKIFHIHWKDFNKELSKLSKNDTGIEQKILEKIIKYLNYKGFVKWNGWELDISKFNEIDTSIGEFYEHKKRR